MVEALVAVEADPAGSQLVDGGVDVLDFEVEHRVAGRRHIRAEVHQHVAIGELQFRHPVLVVEHLDAEAESPLVELPGPPQVVDGKPADRLA